MIRIYFFSLFGCISYFAVPWVYSRVQKLLLRLKAARHNALVLTFDDGPGNKLTPAILEKLREHGARATFFLLGRNISGREHIVRQIAEDGHEICSHSYNHLNHWSISPARAVRDIQCGWEAINKSLDDHRCYYPFRPPYGKLTIVTLLYLLLRKIPICYWTLVSGDTLSLRRQNINRAVIQVRKSGGAVYIGHDFDRSEDEVSECVLRSLDMILDEARESNMKIMTFSELSAKDSRYLPAGHCRHTGNVFSDVKEGEIMDVTVIIVNWNTRGLLFNCLKSLKENAGNVDYEVIVVDNNSSDGSPDMVRKEYPEVQLIVNDENVGFAAANNKAIPMAKGRYVLLLNSDTIITDKVVEKTVAYADENTEAAAVGCQIRRDPKTVQMTCFRFPSVFNVFLTVFGFAKIFKKNRILGREWMLWWKRDSERQVDVVSGMYMLVRKKAIEDVGLMDDSFFFYYEETDWCYRFKQAGWKALFYPHANIIHVGGGGRSSSKAMIKMYVQEQKSLLIYLRKHHGTFCVWLTKVFLIIGFVIRCAAWSTIASVKKMKGQDHKKHNTLKQKSMAAIKYLMLGIEP